MQIVYREATPQDGKDYFDSYIETLDNLCPSVGQTPELLSTNIVTMNKQGTHIFIALDEEKDEIVGSASCLISQTLVRQGKKAGHIEEVVVRKGREGNGIGSTLMRMCIAKATDVGCYKIILDCDEKNVGYYEKFGFEEKGREMKIYV